MKLYLCCFSHFNGHLQWTKKRLSNVFGACLLFSQFATTQSRTKNVNVCYIFDKVSQNINVCMAKLILIHEFFLHPSACFASNVKSKFPTLEISAFFVLAWTSSHVLWTHPTQHSKLHLDWFSRFLYSSRPSPYTLQCALERD